VPGPGASLERAKRVTRLVLKADPPAGRITSRDSRPLGVEAGPYVRPITGAPTLSCMEQSHRFCVGGTDTGPAH